MKTKIILSVSLVFSVTIAVWLFGEAFMVYKKYNDLRLYPIGRMDEIKLEKIREPQDVVILGDSHAANWTINGRKLLNLGIPGQSSSQVRIRADYYKNDLKGKILIIIVGANDLKSLSANTDENEVLDNFSDNLTSITESLRNNFETIYISTIPPLFWTSIENRFLYAKNYCRCLLKMNEIIVEFCRQNNFKAINSYTILNQAKEKAKLSSDGIHLNLQAYQLLNREIGL
jgi:lysophospholipase L1-like esterase